MCLELHQQISALRWAGWILSPTLAVAPHWALCHFTVYSEYSHFRPALMLASTIFSLATSSLLWELRRRRCEERAHANWVALEWRHTQFIGVFRWTWRQAMGSKATSAPLNRSTCLLIKQTNPESISPSNTHLYSREHAVFSWTDTCEFHHSVHC